MEDVTEAKTVEYKPDGELLQKLRDAYVAAKQCDTAKCAELLEECLAVVKPAKERKEK